MLRTLCLLAITATGLLAAEVAGESRILGGTDAVKGQFPHHVQVRFIDTDPEPYRPRCGGSIIGGRFVLTTGFCVSLGSQNVSVKNILVVAGEVDLLGPGIKHQVASVKLHPNRGFLKNDIAVVRVTQPFKFSANVRVIPLPTKDTPVMDNGSAVKATIVGWGIYKPEAESDHHKYPRVLQWLRTTTMSLPECKQLHAKGVPGNEKYLNDEQICTGNTPEIAACHADYGGGLITQGLQPVLIGLLVTTWNGCPSPVPNVYERVFPHLGFIRSAMQP